MTQHWSYKKTAALIAAFLILLCAVSLVSVLWPAGEDSREQYIADIYQNGTLLMSIPLTEDDTSETFLIQGEGGCTNEIALRPGSIGIISADCPDQLCVRQGFIRDSGLPVVCLPNRLVIRLRPLTDESPEDSAPDIIAY